MQPPFKQTVSTEAFLRSNGSSVRSDSPEEHRQHPLPSRDPSSNWPTAVPTFIVGPASTMAEYRRRNVQKTHRPKSQSIAETSHASAEREFHFASVNPTAPKNKTEMRAIRQHVMFDYLDRNVQRKGQHREHHHHHDRQHCDSDVNELGSQISLSTRGQQIEAVSRSGRTPSSTDENTGTPISSTLLESESNNARTPDLNHLHPTFDDGHNLVIPSPGFQDVLYRPVSSDGNMSLYMATKVTEHSFQYDGIGGKVNPFDTWPTFENKLAEVERLKFLCNRCFSCEAISQRWVPAMLVSKHAFYSTISISATHDDIMKRELGLDGGDRIAESYQRTAIRIGVIQMINMCLSHEKRNISDQTIMAILHLLYSELMGGDQNSVQTHQRGLDCIVQMRGGLEQLGVGGELAKILTITMYLIALLYDGDPAPEYTLFAKQCKTEPPPPSNTAYPGSPVYSSADFFTFKRSTTITIRTIQILSLTRHATEAFAEQNRISSVETGSKRKRSRVLVQLCDQVSSFDREEGPTNSETSVYEATRLACRLWTYALAHNTSISSAANACRAIDGSKTPPGTMSLEATRTPSSAIHVQIKDALKHTRLDELWGPMAGVLYWICIVAHAAAGSRQEKAGKNTGENVAEEGARRWLAAVMVRCAILLGFEHTMAVLGMLKRLVAIQQVLRADTEDMSKRRRNEHGEVQLLGGKRRKWGPQPPAHVQQATMGDFAWDFRKA